MSILTTQNCTWQQVVCDSSSEREVDATYEESNYARQLQRKKILYNW